MTRIIVGLGNPGPRYRETRHNVGFAVIAELSERHQLRPQKRDLAVVATGKIGDVSVVLAQPTTMMNRSGRAVAALLRAHNVHDLHQLLVVYDEMDLPLGRIRMRARGSAGGHNGIKSIIEAVRSPEFPRLRIGVGRPMEGEDPIDHVLSRFRPEERPLLDRVLHAAADAVECWLQVGTEETMNRFNQWRAEPDPIDAGQAGDARRGPQ